MAGAKYISMIKLWTICAILLMAGKVQATHIVGGELTYRCLGDQVFEVTLIVRRDCANASDDAPFDDPALVGIYRGQGELITSLGVRGVLQIPFMGEDTISNEETFDCGAVGGAICVHETVYRDTVRLPEPKYGYIFAYQRCCRNGIINNILDPLETGTTFIAEVPPTALLECNSQPVFQAWPPVYTCIDEEIDFDHSAIDIDGDSLVYKLCTPYSGATIDEPKPSAPSNPRQLGNVEWLSPYNLNNLLGGDPLTIDPNTGRLTGKPDLVGTYLVGICVEEYRDGVLLSTVGRDLEINVRACVNPITVDFEATNNDCDGDLTVDFNNLTVGADSYTWYFDYPNTDPAFTSNEVNPSFDFPEEGNYTVRLEATRDSDGCTAIKEKTITVSNTPLVPAFDVVLSSCEMGDFIELIDQSYDSTGITTPVAWEWSININGNTQTFNTQNVIVDVSGADQVEVTLTVTSSSGCESSITDTIDVGELFPNPDFKPVLQGCTPQYTLEVIYLPDANPGFTVDSLVWTYTADGMTQNFANLDTINVSSVGEIVTVGLLVYYSNGCVREIIKDIDILDLFPELQIQNDLKDNCIGSDTVLVNLWTDLIGGSISGTPSEYNWIVNGTPFGSGDSIQVEMFGDTTIEVIVDAFFNGCVFSDTTNITTGGEADLEIEVEVNCDEPYSVTLIDITDGVAVDSFWLIGNNEFDGDSITVEISDTTTIIRWVEFANGCTASDTFTFYEDDFDLSLEIGNDYVQDTISPFDVTFFPILTGSTSFGTPVYTWIYDLGSGPVTFVGDSLMLTLTLDQDVNIQLFALYDNGCELMAEENFNGGDCERDPDILEDINCDDLENIVITLSDTTILEPGISVVSWEWIYNGQTSQDSTITFELGLGDIVEVNLTVIYSDGCEGMYSNTFDSDDFQITVDYNVELLGCKEGFGSFLFTDNTTYPEACFEIDSMIWVIDGETYFGDSIIVDILLGSTVEIEYTVVFTDGTSISTSDDANPDNDILNTNDYIEIVDIEIVDNSDVFCGDSIDVAIVNPDPELIYNWSYDSEFSNIVGTGITLITIADETFMGVVYAQAISDSLCKYGQGSLELENFDIDISFDMSVDLCAGDTIDFEVINNDTSQMLTFVWKDENGVIIEGDSTASPVIGIPDDFTGEFFLVLCTENQFGCTSMDTIDFNVGMRGQLEPFTYELDSCGGLTINFMSDNPSTGSLYWDFGDGTGEFADDPSHEYPAPGTYLVTISDSSAVCADSTYMDSITVPEFIEINIGIDTIEYSAGDTVMVTATTNGDPGTIVWCNEEGDSIYTGNPLIYLPMDSIEKVYAKITDDFGCSDTTCTILKLRDDCPDSLMIDAPNAVCPGDTFQLELIMDKDPSLFTYLWDPDECIISGGDTHMPTVVAFDSKTFSVLVMREGFCEDTIVSVFVEVSDPQVTIGLESGENFICLGEEGTLIVTPDDPNCEYTWSTGETGSEIIVSPEVNTTYTVVCVDTLGCEASDSFELEVRLPNCDETDIFLPTAFSPNGDNVNDVLFVRGKFVDEMELSIVNRWGQEVFYSNDQSMGWDGTYNGEPVAMDAFAYTLKVVCIDGGSYAKVGNVTLIR